MGKNRTFVKTVFLIAIMQYSLAVIAQKVKTVDAEYTFCAPSNLSLIEAKEEAIKRARTEALAEHFGRIVTSNNFVGMDNVDGQSHVSFYSLGESEVKGEWLEDIVPPKILNVVTQEDLPTCITVQVKGKAMEIVSAPIKIEIKILKNGTENHFESDDFKAGSTPDHLYMSFRSPASGYLAIYMIDDEGNAFRLLPYSCANESIFRIEHDEKYIFFSGQDGGDELYVYCNQSIEFNHIYTIFSPSPFTRSLDNGVTALEDGTILPPQLSLKDFQKWLVNIRKHDKELSIDRKTIRVKKQ